MGPSAAAGDVGRGRPDRDRQQHLAGRAARSAAIGRRSEAKHVLVAHGLAEEIAEVKAWVEEVPPRAAVDRELRREVSVVHGRKEKPRYTDQARAGDRPVQ